MYEVDIVHLHAGLGRIVEGEPSLVAPEYKSQYPNADLLSPRLRKYLTNAERAKDKYQEMVTRFKSKKFK